MKDNATLFDVHLMFQIAQVEVTSHHFPHEAGKAWHLVLFTVTTPGNVIALSYKAMKIAHVTTVQMLLGHGIWSVTNVIMEGH
jgi:hypothetical protein